MPALGNFMEGQIVAASAAGPARLIMTPGSPILAGGVIWRQQTITTPIGNQSVDLSLGNWIHLVLTTNAAYGVNAATWGGAALSAANTPVGMPILFTIQNSSGGAAGAFTMTGPWKGASAGFGAPGNNAMVALNMVVLSPTQIIGTADWMVSTAV